VSFKEQAKESVVIRIAYHFDGRIGQVEELGKNFALFARGVQLRRIPQRQDSANQLSKAFCPSAVGIRLTLCSASRLTEMANSQPALPSAGLGEEGQWEGPRTGILVIQFQKIALVIELVLVAVEKGKNRLQLRDGILCNVHDGHGLDD
jgi:hypothetical protein